MNRQFVEEVLNKLNTEFSSSFKKIGIFNNDFDKQEDGTGQPLNFPALFLSFPEEVNYLQSSSGNQRTENFKVRLYIAVKMVTDKNVLDVLDLKQSIYFKMSGFKPSNSSGFVRKSEMTDEDRKGYYVYIQDYETNLIDMTAYIENKRIPVTLEKINVAADLQIDPNTYDNIRTDKEL